MHKEILQKAKKNKKKCIYIYGPPGVGKTYLLNNIKNTIFKKENFFCMSEKTVYKDRPNDITDWKEKEVWRKVSFKEKVEKENVKNIWYISDLFSFLINANSEGKFQRAIDDIKTEKYLFIDDLGAEEKTSDFRLEVISQIIDYRYRFNINCKDDKKKLRTFITSNFTMDEIKNKYNDRISSRLTAMSHQAEIKGEDKRISEKSGMVINNNK